MRAYRSPLRLFVFGMIGVILILAAVDVMFGHWLSTAPESNDGALSTRGQAQQRGDIVWGAAMIGIGTLLVGGAVVELVRRRSVAEVSQEGLTVAIGPHETPVFIPWGAVESIRTDEDLDPYDGSRRSQLVIRLADGTGIPDDPLGAVRRGDELRVDAEDWSRPVDDIASSAREALHHHRSMEEIARMGPPSVTWDTTVATNDDADVKNRSAGVPEAGSTVVGVDGGGDEEELEQEDGP